jgi:hypothetical protein
VIAWHRKGFRLYWRWKSRAGKCGRPRVSLETRELIRQMSQANPLWGAPRIHGELLKLGIEISQATVPKYMSRQGKSPSQSWRTFLENHVQQIVATDFLVVRTVSFRLLFVFVVIAHHRRNAIHFNVTAHPCPYRKFNLTCDGVVWIKLSVPCPRAIHLPVRFAAQLVKACSCCVEADQLPLSRQLPALRLPSPLMLPANSDDAIRPPAAEK